MLSWLRADGQRRKPISTSIFWSSGLSGMSASISCLSEAHRSGHDGQCVLRVLYQHTMEMVHSSSDLNVGGLHLGHSEHHSQCFQRTHGTELWIGTRLSSPPKHIPKMGSAEGGSLHKNKKCPLFCSWGGVWTTILGGIPLFLSEGIVSNSIQM